MSTPTPEPDAAILEEEIESFARSLAQDGLTGTELHRAGGILRLFLLHYLCGHARKSLSSVDSNDVTEFVGTWYIRHVANVTPSSIQALLEVLSRFFRVQQERGAIEMDRAGAIERVIGNESFFLRRLEEYRGSVE